MRLVLGLMMAWVVCAETPRTLRVSYVHSGKAGEERFALTGVALEGAWAGPAKRVEDLNLGKYLVEVRESKTGAVLFSRGFCSIYGEWETTDEARVVSRGFEESVRFPVPAGRVKVVVKKRDKANLFQEVWTVEVDPAGQDVDRAAAGKGVKVWAVEQNGAPAEKVDLLLIGDGYTAAEMEKWHADARRLAETLFAVSPFKERRKAFNVWAVDVASEESGVGRPSEGVYRRSAVRANYDAFGSERYVLTFADGRMREIAAAAPYDFVEIVVNGRTYGGGGIHGLYATVASDNRWTPYVFVHEFGHHFAGLADEYYTSEVAYAASAERVEPWEPNVTADGGGGKWRELVTAGVGLPTKWAKAEFEAMQKETQARRKKIRAERRPEREMEDLFETELAASRRLLGVTKGVGAYEGAMYEATGYYRSEADCIMFTRTDVFCAACRRAIGRVIDYYSGAR